MPSSLPWQLGGYWSSKVGSQWQSSIECIIVLTTDLSPAITICVIICCFKGKLYLILIIIADIPIIVTQVIR